MKTIIKILIILIPKLLFGQIDLVPPNDTALVFLPNIVSTQNHEHSSPSINDNNSMICWSMWKRPKPKNPKQTIMLLDFKAVKTPKPIEFSSKFSNGGPVWIDKNKMLFYSKRPIISNNPDESINDLWICERNDTNWKEPYCLNFSKFTKFAFAPTITNSGTIYFVGFADSVENNMGIYRSKLGKVGYEKPKLLSEQINSRYFDWTPFISADESFLIFSSNRPGSNDKGGDLFISFKNSNYNWSKPINMGAKVNTDRQERFPSVSRDGRILFFTRATNDKYDDVFWIDSRIIDEIKKRHQ